MRHKVVRFGRVRGTSPIPAEVKLKKSLGRHFGHEWGVAFRLPRGELASVFLDKGLSTGNHRTIMKVLGRASIAGYVVTCENKMWRIEVEPISAREFGIIIYTQRGKALIAGTGKVTKAGKWRASFKTLYPGIRNSRRVTVQGGVRGGTGQATYGEVSGTLHF
jgi:hypothetical protein